MWYGQKTLVLVPIFCVLSYFTSPFCPLHNAMTMTIDTTPPPCSCHVLFAIFFFLSLPASSILLDCTYVGVHAYIVVWGLYSFVCAQRAGNYIHTLCKLILSTSQSVTLLLFALFLLRTLCI